MIDERKQVGILGETIARKLLRRTGYQILHNNFKCKLGEIDLVARDGDTLVFIEVKMRRSSDYGSPAESILWRKRKKLIMLAYWYVQEFDLEGINMRFDVVAITGEGKGARTMLIKDAFWEV